MMPKVPTELGCILAILLGTLIPANAIASDPTVVKLAYQVVSKSNHDGVLNINAKVKVNNTGTTPIYSVTAAVLQAGGATVERGLLYIGDVKPGESVVSPDFVLISFDSSTEEPPEIVWQVEYIDTIGNRRTESMIID
jgi:hypothetical protein